ncbi:helix-turn-helix transcriptional regulator [Streptomyces sp. NPDC048142]|uniref:helix-turn-helix transcriptional regulator n=1 Tax=Streptomyces sp. NPDC048142 TaxID=3365501 RepID=UPI0037115203
MSRKKCTKGGCHVRHGGEGEGMDTSGSLMTPGQAAEYMGVAVSTLANWRCRGEGPPFVKAGKRAVRYRVADLDRWLSEGALRA